MSVTRWPEASPVECWSERDTKGPPDFRVFDGGAAASCFVYCEILPGGVVGWHRDGAEEVIVVVEGAVEVEMDGQRHRLGKGDLAVVPKDLPHRVSNAGPEPARFVGVFVAPRIRNVFERPLMPFGETDLETPTPM